MVWLYLYCWCTSLSVWAQLLLTSKFRWLWVWGAVVCFPSSWWLHHPLVSCHESTALSGKTCCRSVSCTARFLTLEPTLGSHLKSPGKNESAQDWPSWYHIAAAVILLAQLKRRSCYQNNTQRNTHRCLLTPSTAFVAVVNDMKSYWCASILGKVPHFSQLSHSFVW